MQRYFKFSELDQKAKDMYAKNPPVFIGVAGFLLLLLLALIAILSFKLLKPESPERTMYLPEMQAIPLSTPTIAPQVTETPSSQLVSGSEWIVNAKLGESTIDGYASLDIEFLNPVTGRRVNGHCQSKHDPDPEVGDTYILMNSGLDGNGQEIWLFVPKIINGQEVGTETKYQRFRLTQ